MRLSRFGAVAFGAALAIGALAAPAWAHVQVEATPGSPGAVDAVLKITAAGESATAGVAKLEVVAEPAIPADQVTFVSGPTGWAVGPGGSSGGFTLSGPAIAKGEDAVVSLKVKALPDVPQLTFKVVQTYGFTSRDRDDMFQEIATAFNFPMKDVDQTVDEVIPHPTD